DDSAGQSLADTPPATLLRTLVAAVDSAFAPTDLLALLKHPLCTLGLARAGLLDAARRLDRKCLRGLKPESGVGALRRRVADCNFGKEDDRRRVIDLVERLHQATAPLVTATAGEASPHVLLEASIAAAEACAPGDALWT